jgi:seryl-tRNA synthetase
MRAICDGLPGQMKLENVYEQEIVGLRKDSHTQFAQETTKMREELVNSDEVNKRILQDLKKIRKQLAQKDTKNSRLVAANEAQKEKIAALRKQQARFTQETGRRNAQIAAEKAKTVPVHFGPARAGKNASGRRHCAPDREVRRQRAREGRRRDHREQRLLKLRTSECRRPRNQFVFPIGE